MNEDMKAAWLEITQMLGETTKEELDVFLRTWQRAVEAEREACAKVVEEYETNNDITATWLNIVADAIRARSNT